MRIFYGVCGVGQGHAGRSITMIEELGHSHEVHVFTCGEALKLMQVAGIPNLHEVPGLYFHFKSKTHGIGAIYTIKNFAKFTKNARSNIAVVEKVAETFPPDLVITDFESVTSHFAKKHKIKLLALDNQHKFLMRQKGLPIGLQLYSMCIGVFVYFYIARPDFVLTSTFHGCDSTDLKFKNINVMIRKSFTKMEPTIGDHVLVYIKPNMQDKILSILKNVDVKFKVYGTEGLSSEDNIEIMPVSNDQFAADLASCKAVISTAGNQLVGESKYFGKKLFVFPLSGQYEQYVNAWWVAKDGLGDWCHLKDLNSDKIKSFLKKDYQINSGKNGLTEAMELLKPYLKN